MEIGQILDLMDISGGDHVGSMFGYSMSDAAISCNFGSFSKTTK